MGGGRRKGSWSTILKSIRTGSSRCHVKPEIRRQMTSQSARCGRLIAVCTGRGGSKGGVGREREEGGGVQAPLVPLAVWHRMMNVLIKLEATQQPDCGCCLPSTLPTSLRPCCPIDNPNNSTRLLFWATGASVDSCCCFLGCLAACLLQLVCHIPISRHKYSL